MYIYYLYIAMSCMTFIFSGILTKFNITIIPYVNALTFAGHSLFYIWYIFMIPGLFPFWVIWALIVLFNFLMPKWWIRRRCSMRAGG